MRSVTLIALTASLSGFLFGFDTAVISGAEQAVQALWRTTDAVHGLAISAALWGTVVGALTGHVPADRYGRRATLFWIGVLYAVSAIGSALAWDEWSFMLFRLIGGLGVGASSVAAPAYIAEIAPRERRGQLVAFYQLSLVAGILVAFASNYALSGLGQGAWRWMLGIEAVPALAYTLLTLTLPESPRWLASVRGDRAGALAVLERLVPGQAEAVLAEVTAGRADTSVRLFVRRLRLPVLLAFLIAAFNQLSGINAVIYFAPRIFGLAGFEAQTALLATVGIGAVNLAATLVGLWLIDRAGRRTLLVAGCAGYVLSLGALAYGFAAGAFALVPLAVFAFIASHAVGSGAIIWGYVAEVFPNEVRAKGQALGSGTHWVFAAAISLVMPAILSSVAPPVIFGTFAALMAVQLVFALMIMPETKGRSLEELAAALER